MALLLLVVTVAAVVVAEVPDEKLTSENPRILQTGVQCPNASDSHGIQVASWRWETVKTPFIYTTFILIAALCKIGYHHADFLSSIVPESCLLIILGTFVGLIFYFVKRNYGTSMDILPQFTSDTFFLFLLPPIILESAYSLHDRAFFSNLCVILLYAVLGTLINCFAIGATLYGLSRCNLLGLDVSLVQCLVFSALISAVDPVAVLAIFQEVGVNKVLYFLVFGESLLNDAVTVVLYTMMVSFSTAENISAHQVAMGVAAFLCNSLGALVIGVAMGVLTALVTKHTENVRVVEPLAMLAIAYLSYLLAEMVHFSGIISIIGCGIIQAQYAKCNISQKSCTTVKYFSKMLSAVCDTIIFLFLGMVLVNEEHKWSSFFVAWATFFCLFYRFTSVFFLTYLANRFERVQTINLEEQFIMAYGGLRGAVAFSLATMLDKNTTCQKEVFVTTTLFIILFTVFIQGATIKPLVNLLKIRTQSRKVETLFTEVNKKVVNNIMAGVEEVTGSHGGNYWALQVLYYNHKYVKRWLQRDCSESNLTRVYTKVALADHFAHLYGPATAIEDNRPFNIYRDTAEVPQEEEGEEEEEETMLLEKQDRPKFTLEDSPTKPSPLKRQTTLSLFTPSKKEDDPGRLLQKALQDNPYNKYHQRYNRNLVDDDQQELDAHLRARRLRARRLTLVAMRSAESLGREDRPELCRPSSAPVYSAERNDGTCYLLRRARLRRSFRREESVSSRPGRLERQGALVDSGDDAGLEVIREENGRNGGDVTFSMPAEGQHRLSDTAV